MLWIVSNNEYMKSRPVWRKLNKTTKKEIIIPLKEPNKTTSRRYVCNESTQHGDNLVSPAIKSLFFSDSEFNKLLSLYSLLK